MRKKPLECVLSVYTNSENAIAAANRLRSPSDNQELKPETRCKELDYFANPPVNAARKGCYLLHSLTPTNKRHKNPRPTLAVRPGISCSAEGCGSLLIVGSVAHRNDRSVLSRHHVIPIDLAPFMSRWRTAKVVLPIIDLVASVPVFLVNL